jgi:hypothetical protein
MDVFLDFALPRIRGCIRRGVYPFAKAYDSYFVKSYDARLASTLLEDLEAGLRSDHLGPETDVSSDDLPDVPPIAGADADFRVASLYCLVCSLLSEIWRAVGAGMPSYCKFHLLGTSVRRLQTMNNTLGAAFSSVLSDALSNALGSSLGSLLGDVLGDALDGPMRPAVQRRPAQKNHIWLRLLERA